MRKKVILYALLNIVFFTSVYAQSYDTLIDRALSAIEKDSLEQAEHLFKEALRSDPANRKNAMIFSNLGTVQRRLGKEKEALESYSLALNGAPSQVTILLNRASLYLQMGHLDQAYIDYCNVIDQDESNKDALQFRAYIYMCHRQYQEARLDYRKLLEAEPQNKTARIGMVMVNQKDKRYQEALKDLNLMVTDYPEDISLLKLRAGIQVEMDLLDMALLDLETASQISPTDAEIYVMYGEIYLAKGEKHKAYAAFEKAIELGVPRPQLQDLLKASKGR